MISGHQPPVYICSECGATRNVEFWEYANPYAEEDKLIRLCRNCGHEKVMSVITRSLNSNTKPTQYILTETQGEVSF